MKRILILASVLTFSTAALAEDGRWPGRVDNNPFPYSPYYNVTDLQMQMNQNRDYHRALRARLIENGGCNADFLPFWVAEYCDSKAFGVNFGSDGGSE